jgi:hypothetical protein
VVNMQNMAKVMTPRLRKQIELLPAINLDNLVINNVNHLKEMLLNYHLPCMNFEKLTYIV